MYYRYSALDIISPTYGTNIL